MASLLESQLAATVAKAFSGRLLTGTLRREIPGEGTDEHGDPNPGTVETYPFEGIIETYSLYYRNQAGIPDGDMKILVIAGSTSVTPKQGDQVQMRDGWYQVRAVSTDPALATYELQSSPIEAP